MREGVLGALLRWSRNLSEPVREPYVPLDFLKRKSNADRAHGAPLATPPAPSIAMPEEVVAQEHQLKLYYAGKSSEGVRMKGRAEARSRTASDAGRACHAEVEVVEPLPIEFSQAAPTIVSPPQAMQWLNAHHILSPITRHALVVLESLDAVDPAFDTFVCALLDGEVDTSGYPDTTRSSEAWPRTGMRRPAT